MRVKEHKLVLLMSMEDYFFKEDKTELDKFLHRIAKKGYKNLWAPDCSNGEVRDIGDYLASVRKFNRQIPPHALIEDGERVLPFWAYLGTYNSEETGRSIEVCIDYSPQLSFHIKQLHVCKWYPNDESTLFSVMINSPRTRLPNVTDIWRLAGRIDNMRKQNGLRYLDKKFNSDDKIVKSCFHKTSLKRS